MRFKNIAVLSGALCLAASGAHAEGYAGALLELSSYNSDGLCARYTTQSTASTCDNRTAGLKVFAGVGGGSASGVEAAYIDFGRTRSTVDGQSLDVRVSSFVVAGVLRASPLPSLSVNAKLGVAASKATAKNLGNSVSRAHPSLYLGLGVDCEIVKNVKAVGSIDFVRAKLDGERFGVVGFGLGAQVGF